MAHPFQEHRSGSASKKRAGMMMKAAGGKARHSDEAADKKLIKKMIAQHEKSEHDVPGFKRGGRVDKFARGGKAKGKQGTQINIAVVAPSGKNQPDADALPGGPAAAPMPPRPPLGAGGPPVLPPGGPMAGPPGMPPPGMKPPGMMKRGGKVTGQRGGSETGVGRLDKVRMQKKRGK